MSAHGGPVRNRQKMPFSTRRSSTRGTPRGLLGSNGWITDHSKSVKSKRAIATSLIERLNQRSTDSGIPFMRSWPSLRIAVLAPGGTMMASRTSCLARRRNPQDGRGVARRPAGRFPDGCADLIHLASSIGGFTRQVHWVRLPVKVIPAGDEGLRAAL
jgi:hypothetical protein